MKKLLQQAQFRTVRRQASIALALMLGVGMLGCQSENGNVTFTGITVNGVQIGGNGFQFTFEGETSERKESGASKEPISLAQIDYEFGDVVVEGSDQLSWDWHLTTWAEKQEDADAFAEQIKLVHSVEGETHRFALDIPKDRKLLRGIKADFTLRLPHDVKLVMENRHGDTRVTNRNADIELDSSHGNATLESITGVCQVSNRHGSLLAKQIIASTQAVDLAAEANPGDVDLESDNKAKKSGYSLFIESAHGEVGLSDVSSDLAKLESQHGKATVEHVKCAELAIDAQHGSLKLDNLECEKLDLKASHLKTKAARVNASTFTAKSSHADVDLAYAGENFSWEGSHSGMKLDVLNAQLKSLSLQTSHANIRVAIPKDLAVSLETSASHGKVSSKVNSSGSGCPVSLKTSHGDIRVQTR